MNEYILLVMKWLKNPESVSQEELDANFEAARDAAACHDFAYWAACDARDAAACHARDAAAYWVDEYFESTCEDKQSYIDKLGE
jgi:hypothetical protein